MKKRKFSPILIAITILLVIAGILFLYKVGNEKNQVLQKKVNITPDEHVAQTKTPLRTAAIKPAQHADSKMTTKEEAGLQPDSNKTNQPNQLQDSKTAALSADVESLTIRVAQSAREKGEFLLKNTGNGDTFVNIYKSQPNSSNETLKKQTNELISYRKNRLPEKIEKKDLVKAALFNSTPWLMTFPYYEALGASEAKAVQVAVDARDLEAGEYKVDLIILGSRNNESLILPVNIIVERAAKIKISKVIVDDGLSGDTTGNADHIANPGEKVSITLYLSNTGSADAKNLKISLKAQDNNLNIIGDTAIQIPYISSQGETQIKVTAEVGQNSNPEIPPVINLTISDDDGVKATENFYAGDPDKIKYPLGAKENKKLKIPDL